MAHDVFISYSAKDKPTADAVCALLESKGIRCWVAPRDILPGRDWDESLGEAIRSARVMVVVFSASANSSRQVAREVELAVNNGLTVIPLRIENVQPAISLNYSLTAPHWLDAFTPPLEKHLENLAMVVRKFLGANVKSAIPVPERMPQGAIFISYASEDREAVKVLKSDLEAANLLVWFDKEQLTAGHDWSAEIRQNLERCALFIPVISKNTQQLHRDAYFREEWRQADEIAKRSQEGDRFILPVLLEEPGVSGQSYSSMAVPESFETQNFTVAHNGVPPVDFVERVKLLVAERKAKSVRPPGDTTMVRRADVEGKAKDQAQSKMAFEEIIKAAGEESKKSIEKKHEGEVVAEILESIKEAPASLPKPVCFDENVQFTVFRPDIIVPEKWQVLLAFAHLSNKRPDDPAEAPDPLAEVTEQARRLLGEAFESYKDVTQDSSQNVPREGMITFVPEVPGLVFNPPSRSFAWTEETVHREEFRMKAATTDSGKMLRGRLTVYLGAIILAEINLAIKVEAGPASSEQNPPVKAVSAKAYRKIFASYSRRDMAIVQQFEHLAQSLGDRYLRDLVNLRAGEEWNPGLEQLIKDADVFQLFWSSNSMRSKFVRQEWEFALRLNRPHFIRPTYWENPLPELPSDNLPPDELRKIHFQKISHELTGTINKELPAVIPKGAALEMDLRPPPKAQRFNIITLLALALLLFVVAVVFYLAHMHK